MRLVLVLLLSLLFGCGVGNVSSTKSITDSDYTGKKYYFGWGAAGYSDSSFMHNEAKYDVKHTNDLFTKSVGGSYIGTTQIGYQNVSGYSIKTEWGRLTGLIQQNDMYIQYSSGHGSYSGLGVGVSYNEMRDTALNLSAKEIIVFTMACYSGNLINSFNAKKSVWKDWQANGRTLFVMSSSQADEMSQDGPGTDVDEPSGIDGSAGTAFGHALWKAIIGYADENRDKKLTLEEIKTYTVEQTRETGGHTPAITGAYDPNLVMALVPTYNELKAVIGDGDELEQIRLDGVLR